jgi:outer membrane protein OmpA-like peptidoglycan-associated protein
LKTEESFVPYELESALEWELEDLERELESGGAPTGQTPGTACAAPAQVARDRCPHPGTQTCPPIPNLLCLKDIVGVPFEYVLGTATDQTTQLTIVNRRKTPVVQKFIPAVRDALNGFVGNMSRFGMPVEAILTLGSLYCRCVSGKDTLSNHSFGDAIDVAGLRWPSTGGPASAARETVVYNWRDAGQRVLLRRINACLRLTFNTVIDYHRPDHRDHFHCDTNSRAGSVRAMGKSATTAHFVQEALTHVLRRLVRETGIWDPATLHGLRDFSGVTLRGADDPRMNAVLDQLFTAVASDAGSPPSVPAGPMGLDHFPYDSPALAPYQRRLIERIAHRVVASWQTSSPVRVIHLAGHTDSRGPAAYNHGLGIRRAKAVEAALTQAMEKARAGIARGIRFVAVSHGATRPVTASRAAAGLARNRRVTVSLGGPAPAANQAEWGEYESALEAPAAPQVSVAPPLLFSEQAVPSATYYVNITLGKEKPAPPMTGIFVPSRYQNPSQLDLILYLHGHHKGGKFPADLSIDNYWLATRFPFFALREGVNTSKKSVILVAPTLSPSSDSGRLSTPGGLGWYLDQVVSALKTYGPFREMSSMPPLGNIILACHSGGGWTMREIAMTPQKYVDKIRQCWGFDCLYNKGDETAWARWAKANPDKQLFIHFGNGGTAEKSRTLQANAKGLSNVWVDGSETLDHNHVPITHWQKRLEAARFLLQT